MKINTNGKWVFFSNADTMKQHAKENKFCYDFMEPDFKGVRWYYFTTKARYYNSATDYIGVYLTAEERADEVKEGMKELADELRVARQKATEGAK